MLAAASKIRSMAALLGAGSSTDAAITPIKTPAAAKQRMASIPLRGAVALGGMIRNTFMHSFMINENRAGLASC